MGAPMCRHDSWGSAAPLLQSASLMIPGWVREPMNNALSGPKVKSTKQHITCFCKKKLDQRVFLSTSINRTSFNIPNASRLPLFLVTGLWFRHFLEPKLWRWTRTLVQAFPFYFFCPKGSKRCCTAPNAIDIALESAPLRSFLFFFYAL